ncbi:ATP-binding cassette domain-containing protein [Salinarimonas sp.]|uniref:ATP-binding cassette domain-containing protein n=1 Tax=Salinarimonas sp. TaxID=2766526 RepID=UPI0032D93CB0
MVSDDLDTRPASDEALRTRGLAYRVEERVLLHPLDLAFAAGEASAVVGHNGSGKSTLLKLLARQIAPTAGEARLRGLELARWPARAFAREVAFLAQETPRGLGLTVRELVAHGRYPWHGALGRFGARDRMKVEEALALTRLDGLHDRMVDTLSGGERQRAWIAMLVAQDARCLLLDEPISALDIAHQIEILALLRRLCHERGLCVIVVLHDLNMAARFCDRIVALKQGRLIAQGTPRAVVEPAVLHRVYGVPMAVVANEASGDPVAYAL